MPRDDGSTRPEARAQDGTALVAALTTVTLLAALGGGLLLVVMAEVRIAALHREGLQALYAADGMVEFVIAELAGQEVTAALTGASASGFMDGPAGERQVGNRTIHLDELTQIERCGQPRACDVGAIRGTDAPWWQLYAYGTLDRLLGVEGPPIYLVAWVADDPSENDGDSLRDGLPGVNPGHGIVAIRVHAYGVAAHRRLEVLVGGLPDRPRLVSWLEPDPESLIPNP